MKLITFSLGKSISPTDITILCNKDSKELRKAYLKSCEKYGIRFHSANNKEYDIEILLNDKEIDINTAKYLLHIGLKMINIGMFISKQNLEKFNLDSDNYKSCGNVNLDVLDLVLQFIKLSLNDLEYEYSSNIFDICNIGAAVI